MTSYAVVGGGIVGLATARALLRADPGCAVVVLEKEDDWGLHQTGHNSGVVHSGVYYRPGSAKARLCVSGSRAMIEYARDRGIPIEVPGKLIVATETAELGRLEELARRARANGVPARRLTAGEARDHEPEVRCVGALRVEATAVTDFHAVCRALAADLAAAGARLRTSAQVVGLATDGDRTVVETTAGAERADVVVSCAGLQGDRVAAMAGGRPPARIVPFRGEYYQLVPAAAGLVRGLVYPVPDPAFPFLGVHLTRGVDGVVHVGPNAVLALEREGYGRRSARWADVADLLSFPGFWRMGRRNIRAGAEEMRRSMSRRLFAASAARLVPAITEADLRPAGVGVRAQAVRRDGTIVDDFLVLRRRRTLHVLNAPSPAATGALHIGEHVARQAVALAGSVAVLG